MGTLAAGQELTFHFLVYDNQQNSVDDMKFDNFVINGNVVAAAPEPSTVTASGLGLVGLGLLALRRRFARA